MLNSSTTSSLVWMKPRFLK